MNIDANSDVEIAKAHTAEHVQHDRGGFQIRGRARIVAGVLAPRVVDYQVADLQRETGHNASGLKLHHLEVLIRML